jgi:hypothetical protein
MCILIFKFVGVKKMQVMNLESRKISLINWISSLQEPAIIDKMEAIQKENVD